MAADVLADDDPAENRHIEQILLSRSRALGLAAVVTRSPSMERVQQLAERAARCSTPVLVEGERGAGKEAFARAIHGSGARRGRPFVPLRSEGADAKTIEAVLFGEESGRKSEGKALDTSGGTLFLDEIGALPLDAQIRLARILAETPPDASDKGSAPRAGFRLIAATSRRLIDLASHAGFHEPLFNQLNVLPIWLPPLRERRADIPELARNLLYRFADETGRSGVAGISAAAMDLLVAHDWPGNIRELERAVLRAIILSGGGELMPQDFPQLSPGEGDGHAKDRGAGIPRTPLSGVAYPEQVRNEGVSAPDARADRQPLARYGAAWLLDERGEMRPFGALEEEVIRFAIRHYRGRMSEVARRLGIGRSTLYRKMKDYGIAAGEPVVS